jgi:hypothetical protein
LESQILGSFSVWNHNWNQKIWQKKSKVNWQLIVNSSLDYLESNWNQIWVLKPELEPETSFLITWNQTWN